jgi:hypothetical protein
MLTHAENTYATEVAHLRDVMDMLAELVAALPAPGGETKIQFVHAMKVQRARGMLAEAMTKLNSLTFGA